MRNTQESERELIQDGFRLRRDAAYHAQRLGPGHRVVKTDCFRINWKTADIYTVERWTVVRGSK